MNYQTCSNYRTPCILFHIKKWLIHCFHCLYPFSGKMRMLWVIHHFCEFQALTNHMEVEYSGSGVLIFSYLILIHQFDKFGGLRWVEAAWYEWFHWLPLWWPANSVQTGFAPSKLSRGSLIRVSSLAAALMARQ